MRRPMITNGRQRPEACAASSRRASGSAPAGRVLAGVDFVSVSLTIAGTRGRRRSTCTILSRRQGRRASLFTHMRTVWCGPTYAGMIWSTQLEVDTNGACGGLSLPGHPVDDDHLLPVGELDLHPRAGPGRHLPPA